MSGKIAAFTIVSNNYLAHARALAKSFQQHHPEIEFLVVLVDEYDDAHQVDREPFTIIRCTDLPLPAVDYFVYAYDIMELNTAVKPFAFRHFLDCGYSQVVYFDPDILVFCELKEIIPSRDNEEGILIPHVMTPYFDTAKPGDLDILTSGTYNLGFLSLNSTKKVDALIDWWSEKLFTDCVVDIKNGLFVDQKWMDLAPGMIDARILKHPGYNVAYWNLHERILTQSDGRYYTNERDLAFFHFSGFSPKNPSVLSKHQTRHTVASGTALANLLAFYAEQLNENGFSEVQNYSYAYAALPNGVKISRPIRQVIRSSLKNNIALPSPLTEPDDFCRYIATPNSTLSGANIAPVIQKLLDEREDVRQAFPNALHDHSDPGIKKWLENIFPGEYNAEVFAEKFLKHLEEQNPVESIVNVYEKRQDLRNAYPDAFTLMESNEEFCDWCWMFGRNEEALRDCDIDRFKASRSGFRRIIEVYFSRPDIMKLFTDLHQSEVIDQIADWASQELAGHIDYDDIAFFRYSAKRNREWLLKINLVYNCELHRRGVGASVFLLDAIENYLAMSNSENMLDGVKAWMASSDAPDLVWQMHLKFQNDYLLQRLYRTAFRDRAQTFDLFDHLIRESSRVALDNISRFLNVSGRERIGTELDSATMANVFGYFNTASGMGESARSLARVLAAGGVKHTVCAVPCQWLRPNSVLPGELNPVLFGLSDPCAGTNIWISNADDIIRVREISITHAPNTEKNIGYWVWETEILPAEYGQSQIAVDEIWTPSEFARTAIRNTVDCPVHVLPHCVSEGPRAVQQKEVDALCSRLEIEKTSFKILFIFDVKSVIERKNPGAVIEAFRSAFNRSENVLLILKTVGAAPGNFEYQKLRARYKDSRIVWIEETLPEESLRALQQTADCYMSLHRCEGFGLTLLEAMQYSTSVIATGYSGNMMFMDSDNSYLVAYDLVKTSRPYGPYPKGTVWASPDILDASNKLRSIYNCEKAVKSKKRRALQSAEMLSAANVANAYADLLKHIDA